MKKTLKYKAWCLIEAASSQKEIPTLYKTRNQCLKDNTSYYGHECDNPERRGLVCECEIVVKVKGAFSPNKQLREYYAITGERPALLVVGDDAWNKKAQARHKKSVKAKLKRVSGK